MFPFQSSKFICNIIVIQNIVCKFYSDSVQLIELKSRFEAQIFISCLGSYLCIFCADTTYREEELSLSGSLVAPKK